MSAPAIVKVCATCGTHWTRAGAEARGTYRWPSYGLVGWRCWCGSDLAIEEPEESLLPELDHERDMRPTWAEEEEIAWRQECA